MKLKPVCDSASEGVHDAIICEFIDQGAEVSAFGTWQVVCVDLLTDEQDRQGQPLHLRMRYNDSRHPNSKLYLFLAGVNETYGNPFDLTARDFDSDKFINAHIQISVSHRYDYRKKSTYANIDSVIVGNRPMTDLQPESQTILTRTLAGLCLKCGRNHHIAEYGHCIDCERERLRQVKELHDRLVNVSPHDEFTCQECHWTGIGFIHEAGLQPDVLTCPKCGERSWDGEVG